MQDSSTILVFTTSEQTIEPQAEPVPMRDPGRVRYRGEPTDEVQYRGPGKVVQKMVDGAVELSTSALRDSVLRAYRNCLDVIESLPEHSGGAVLEQVTFSLAIDGEGQVGLLSTSAKVGAQVGLTFQVRIPPRQKPENVYR